MKSKVTPLDDRLYTTAENLAEALYNVAEMCDSHDKDFGKFELVEIRENELSDKPVYIFEVDEVLFEME